MVGFRPANTAKFTKKGGKPPLFFKLRDSPFCWNTVYIMPVLPLTGRLHLRIIVKHLRKYPFAISHLNGLPRSCITGIIYIAELLQRKYILANGLYTSRYHHPLQVGTAKRTVTYFHQSLRQNNRAKELTAGERGFPQRRPLQCQGHRHGHGQYAVLQPDGWIHCVP